MKEGIADIAWREYDIHQSSVEAPKEQVEEAPPSLFGAGAEGDHEEDLQLHEVSVDGVDTLLKIWGAPDWTLSTGMSICGGADVLCQFLQNPAKNRTMYCQNQSILELGAGTGVCGLVALVLGASRVLVTDGDTKVLDLLRRNVFENAPLASDLNVVECPQLIWGHKEQMRAFFDAYGHSNVILAADCLYLRQAVEPFWQTIDRLLSKEGVVLYTHVSSSTASHEYVVEVSARYGLRVCESIDQVHIFHRQERSKDTVDTMTTTSGQDRAWREFDIHAGEKEEDIDEVAGSAGFDIFQTDKEQLQLSAIPIILPTYAHSVKLPVIKIWSVPDWSQSTGMAICGGADILMAFLQANAAEYCQCRRILELGSGTGLCGIVAAALGSSRVLSTDGDVKVLTEVLRRNVQENRTLLETLNPNGSIVCPQLIWGQDLDTFANAHGYSDVIVASDCLYMKKTVEPFWKTVRHLLSEDGVVIYVNVCASMATKETIIDTARSYGLELRSEDANGVHIYRRAPLYTPAS